MEKRDSFLVSPDDMLIFFNNHTENRRMRGDKREDDWHHYELFERVAEMICAQCRFEPSDKPHPELTVGRHPSLWHDYRWGGNRHLRFQGRRYPAGFEFEFWYPDSREDRRGNHGYYDAFKGRLATAVERVMFRNVAWKVAAMLSIMGFEERGAEDRLVGRKRVMWEINDNPARHWGRWEDYRNEPYFRNYNGLDRDQKALENGQVKYYRGWDGRLRCGEVYHNINNMWWVILNDAEYTNVANFELFDASPEDFKARRVARDRAKPHEKVRRRIGTKRYNELVTLGVKMVLQEDEK